MTVDKSMKLPNFIEVNLFGSDKVKISRKSQLEITDKQPWK